VRHAYDVADFADGAKANLPLRLRRGVNAYKTPIQSLADELANSDFGVFVFSPDDRTRLRDKTHSTVRDNVIFELGLFVGRLGIERSFIVVPNVSLGASKPATDGRFKTGQ
jgi:hypothetical protein